LISLDSVSNCCICDELLADFQYHVNVCSSSVLWDGDYPNVTLLHMPQSCISALLNFISPHII
jgi:hypothetical protein